MNSVGKFGLPDNLKETKYNFLAAVTQTGGELIDDVLRTKLPLVKRKNSAIMFKQAYVKSKLST